MGLVGGARLTLCTTITLLPIPAEVGVLRTARAFPDLLRTAETRRQTLNTVTPTIQAMKTPPPNTPPITMPTVPPAAEEGMVEQKYTLNTPQHTQQACIVLYSFLSAYKNTLSTNTRVCLDAKSPTYKPLSHRCVN